MQTTIDLPAILLEPARELAGRVSGGHVISTVVNLPGRLAGVEVPLHLGDLVVNWLRVGPADLFDKPRKLRDLQADDSLFTNAKFDAEAEIAISLDSSSQPIEVDGIRLKVEVAS